MSTGRMLTPAEAANVRLKFEELKKLVEQRQMINLELVNKLARALEKVKAGPAPVAGLSGAAAASKQAAASKRSNLPGGLGPDTKRPRLDTETDKRIMDVWRMCSNVLEFLGKKKLASVFMKPVDPVRDGVPDYFKFVSNPMDLGTIKQKLRERRYSDPREFAAEVRLVWHNCRTYNQLGTPVRQWGDQLSDDWEKKWAETGVEAKWDELMAQRDPQAVALDRRIATSARQLIQRVNSISVLPDLDPSRPMTTVEKRKLSIALSELQGDQLADVLNIIAESLTNVNPDDDEEIELDVDQLDNNTLWRLREYCDNVANRTAFKAGAISKGGAVAAAAAGTGVGGLAGGGGATGAVSGAARAAQDNGKVAGTKPPARTESGSESDRYSAEQDVKGSNMVEQPQSQLNFVKNQRTALPVDESATAPKDKSAIATDKKSNKDVRLNASAWTTDTAEEDPAEGGVAAAEGGGDGGGGEEDGDELWDSFRNVAEREKEQKAEEEKRRKELEQERERERMRAVAEARQAKEEEERRMREAEETAAAEARRAKEEMREKEKEELEKQANTAQVYQPPDATAFANAFGGQGANMDELGLVYKHDDDVEDFED